MLQWISSLHKRKDEEMTENQKMDLILQKLGGIEGGLVSVGEDVQSLQGDMQVLKGDSGTQRRRAGTER